MQEVENLTSNDDAYKGASSKENIRKANERVMAQYKKDLLLLCDKLNIDGIDKDMLLIYEPKLYTNETFYVNGYSISIKWKPNNNSTWIRPIFITYRKI